MVIFHCYVSSPEGINFDEQSNSVPDSGTEDDRISSTCGGICFCGFLWPNPAFVFWVRFVLVGCSREIREVPSPRNLETFLQKRTLFQRECLRQHFSLRKDNLNVPELVSGKFMGISYFQWEFQDPKMEVLYHIRPYFGGIFPYIGLT